MIFQGHSMVQAQARLTAPNLYQGLFKVLDFKSVLTLVGVRLT